MIPQLLLVALAVGSQPDARSQLTPQQIRAAIQDASREYLGDFPPGIVRGRDRQYYYGSFVRDLCDKYLRIFERFPAAQQFMSAALPQSQRRDTFVPASASDSLVRP